MSTASTNQRSAPAAERKSKKPKECAGSRKEEKRPNGRAHSEHQPKECAGALKAVPCRCLSAFAGRTRLPTASTNQRSAPAAPQLRGSWCSGITPAQHARGVGFNPWPVHAHVRLRLSPPFGFAVRLAKGGCSAAAGCRTSLLNPI